MQSGVPKPPLSPRISIYRWRPPMIASLAHRVSGLMLIAFVMFFLCFLQLSSANEAVFLRLLDWMHSFGGQVFLCLGGAALIYHWFNGLRFLLLDAGIADSRQAMRTSAHLSVAVGLVAVLIMGVWL